LKSQPPIANVSTDSLFPSCYYAILSFQKLRASLKKWAEGEFKKDPQLSLIPSMYNKMKQEGHDFTDNESMPKREVQLSKDPNIVSSQQEEDDIAKAIELSLKEKTASPKAQTTSLYPSVSTTTALTSGGVSSAPAVDPRKVRALYDFEAAEDNELTFKAGEIIMVIEESDPNWWRGTNHRGEGFFPANFVTADLSAEPEDFGVKETKSNKKTLQLEESQNKQNQQVEINEESIDRLLFLLHEADPSDPSQDSDEMLRLENVVNQMGPLIDSELERVDRKHAQLTQLSSDLIDTINLYHSLMRETERAPPSMGMYSSYPQNQQPMYPGYPGYRMPGMPQANMIPPGMMAMSGQFPQTSTQNFQNPPQPSGPGNFHQPGQNQMIPSQHQMMPGPMTNGLPSQNPQHGPGMLQGVPGQNQPSQQIQAPGKIQEFFEMKFMFL
jgi:signal transducing adaptor molecule